MDPLSVLLTREPPFVTFTLAGRLDGNSASNFADMVAGNLSDEDRSVILDVHELEFVSSAGLRSLLGLAKHLDKLHCKAVLVGVTRSVGMALEIAGFNSLFHRAKNLEAAHAALSPKSGPAHGFFDRLLHRETQI